MVAEHLTKTPAMFRPGITVIGRVVAGLIELFYELGIECFLVSA